MKSSTVLCDLFLFFLEKSYLLLPSYQNNSKTDNPTKHRG